ncbi:hypothetical protein EOB36_05900 [Mesorhizobium sp. M6A.T.Cr.TU.017.01.1.1]|uniref:DUF6161 domain-containing protein n=1 Tax=Mesorhizobium sp. M6A.T.Cr.TU.017.01.1.1 TaxID=2496774 RepID=UPI000FD4B998|nr:DUF6161 domain-containing protein [Mesorhizobium sp. M6A.T.Cr.TU.017.01.1.1]RUV03492.1 hypothetical protein EOB36_05900 [Mesorhizobium sp. M6A.T.Cr.TU.017.01.1.1]
MDGDTYKFVRSVFRTNIYDPGGPNSGEATKLYEGQQADIYKRISHAIATYMTGIYDEDRASINSIRGMVDNIIEHCTKVAPAFVSDVDDKIVLTAKIPVVTNATLEETRRWLTESKASPDKGDDVIAAFAAGLLHEMQPFARPPPNQFPVPVLIELGSYAAWRALESAPLDENGTIADKMATLATTANTLLDDVRDRVALSSNSVRETTESVVERAQSAIEAAQNAAKQAGAFENRAKDLSGQIDAFQATIDANTQDAEDKLSSFLDAAHARSAYKGVRIYWTDRASASWWALMISGFVLFILLVALPAWAIYDNDAVIGLLKNLTEAAGIDVGNVTSPVVLTVATVSRLVVITIPLALYFWLIRLVVRFNMRSMLLMDDARQRATIIETYYKMIEQQAATKEDRALILQALCRPPPGHGNDSIEPPNFTEVINKAIEKP